LPELSDRRRVAALHALLFVAGFSLIFVLLGASATALGGALKYYQLWIARIGGVLIILFGLVCLGVIRIGWLEQERRLQFQHKPVGYLGSALVGMAFGAGWTPCIGPVLGGILSLAATTESVQPGHAVVGGLLSRVGSAFSHRGRCRRVISRLVFNASRPFPAVGDAGERGATRSGGPAAWRRGSSPDLQVGCRL
jgi:hypothetical protein